MEAPRNRSYLNIALGLCIAGFVMLCCCQPATIVAGIAATALSKSVRFNARARGERDPYAETMFYIGITLAILQRLQSL